MAEPFSAETSRGERIEHTPEGRAIANILGPHYIVHRLKPIPVLDFCREVWRKDEIPVLYGRKGIGKSGVLIPYLREQVGDLLPMETGGGRKTQASPIEKPVFFLSVTGFHNDNEIGNQLKSTTAGYELSTNKKYDSAELLLHPPIEAVIDIAKALYGDSPTFNEGELHSRKWRGAFEEVAGILNDNSRDYTLREAMNKLHRLAERASYFRQRKLWFF